MKNSLIIYKKGGTKIQEVININFGPLIINLLLWDFYYYIAN